MIVACVCGLNNCFIYIVFNFQNISRTLNNLGSLSTKEQTMTRFRSVLTPDSMTFQNATVLSEYDYLFSVF